jgi:hypothetical protein
MSDIVGISYPMWTDAIHATMDHIGGPQRWWKNDVYRIEFFALRKPHERAANREPIHQKVTIVTVRDRTGEAYPYSTTQRIAQGEYKPGKPKVEYF